MLDASQSAQGLNLSEHTQNSPPNSKIFHKRLGSHKEWLGGELNRLLKGYSNGQEPATHERGGGCLLQESGKLAVGGVRADRCTIPVRPVGWLQIRLGHSMMKTLSDDKFGLGSRHVRRGARQVRWSSNSNSHIVHRICLVQDWTCSKHVSGTRLRLLNKSDGPDLLWDRSNQFDRCAIPVWPVGQNSAHSFNLVSLHHSWNLSRFWAL
jgi:hypothetical protein